MINLANGAYQREVLRMKGYSDDAIMGMIQPIIVDTHQIGNAYTNYGYYLNNILLPGFLELIIIIVMIYSIGTELKYGTSRQLMKVAGNSVVKALLGKVFVATIAFTILGVILVLTLYHWMHFPIAGSIGNMFLDIFLLVLASEAVGITLIGFLPVPRLALSIGALYSVLPCPVLPCRWKPCRPGSKVWEPPSPCATITCSMSRKWCSAPVLPAGGRKWFIC